ncbi:shikimate dehydrogenase [Salinibacterium sp. SWN167]|uniref:shikimate dehydrogenase n=1 Tax=Salinibacterium sp. SWN167 TaxID=2792054 RepID=UPI0018CED042|nr:shikimate dehydrogenase [Salinibacterium sp. SWN167]MBH0083415.1 shikimate dehydrogenase [Salinibacterium sp. SWN167]
MLENSETSNKKDDRFKLAVLGSPITHSLSPAIHRAAYQTLGFDWEYDAVELTGESLPAFLGALDRRWRGLSLTMPLKRDVVPLLDWADPLVELVGGANTVVVSEGHLRGYNTDVEGALRSFLDAGLSNLDSVWILGAGATAASLLVASIRMGAQSIEIFARTPSKAAPLKELGESLGATVTLRQWREATTATTAPTVIITTVPGGAMDLRFAEAVRTTSVLFDVAYDPWPSEIAASWYDAGGTVISGHDLLINQAIAQVRIFAAGTADVPLPHEADAIDAMRAAIEQPEGHNHS